MMEWDPEFNELCVDTHFHEKIFTSTEHATSFVLDFSTKFMAMTTSKEW